MDRFSNNNYNDGPNMGANYGNNGNYNNNFNNNNMIGPNHGQSYNNNGPNFHNNGPYHPNGGGNFSNVGINNNYNDRGNMNMNHNNGSNFAAENFGNHGAGNFGPHGGNNFGNDSMMNNNNNFGGSQGGNYHGNGPNHNNNFGANNNSMNLNLSDSPVDYRYDNNGRVRMPITLRKGNPRDPSQLPRLVGKVRMYNPTKGWGFILAEGLQVDYGCTTDIFLHSKHFAIVEELPVAFIGHDNTKTQTQYFVQYDLDLSDHSKPQALNVKMYNDGNLQSTTPRRGICNDFSMSPRDVPKGMLGGKGKGHNNDIPVQQAKSPRNGKGFGGKNFDGKDGGKFGKGKGKDNGKGDFGKGFQQPSMNQNMNMINSSNMNNNMRNDNFQNTNQNNQFNKSNNDTTPMGNVLPPNDFPPMPPPGENQNQGLPKAQTNISDINDIMTQTQSLISNVNASQSMNMNSMNMNAMPQGNMNMNQPGNNNNQWLSNDQQDLFNQLAAQGNNNIGNNNNNNFINSAGFNSAATFNNHASNFDSATLPGNNYNNFGFQNNNQLGGQQSASALDNSFTNSANFMNAWGSMQNQMDNANSAFQTTTPAFDSVQQTPVQQTPHNVNQANGMPQLGINGNSGDNLIQKMAAGSANVTSPKELQQQISNGDNYQSPTTTNGQNNNMNLPLFNNTTGSPSLSGRDESDSRYKTPEKAQNQSNTGRSVVTEGGDPKMSFMNATPTNIEDELTASFAQKCGVSTNGSDRFGPTPQNESGVHPGAAFFGAR